MMKADRDRHPREQHIRDAMRLLGDRSQECRDDVEYTLAAMREEAANDRASLGGKTKKAKQAAKRLAAALRRVEAAARNDDLDTMVHLLFPRKTVSDWIRHSDELATTPSGQPRKSSAPKLRAAKEALYLMRKYGATVVTTRGSKFCRLAAILHGDERADMHHWCRRAMRASADPGSR